MKRSDRRAGDSNQSHTQYRPCPPPTAAETHRAVFGRLALRTFSKLVTWQLVSFARGPNIQATSEKPIGPTRNRFAKIELKLSPVARCVWGFPHLRISGVFPKRPAFICMKCGMDAAWKGQGPQRLALFVSIAMSQHARESPICHQGGCHQVRIAFSYTSAKSRTCKYKKQSP